MDRAIRTHLDNLRSEDRLLQSKSFLYLLKATGKRVDWAYEAWDGLVRDLRHKDNHVRAICTQLLANLSASDPQARILKDFAAVLNVTRDERFVTARHSMQSIWKIGLAGKPQQARVLAGLRTRYRECLREKNCTLIRYDINVALKNLYDAVADEAIPKAAAALNATERDLKYRKKYESVWKKRRRSA